MLKATTLLLCLGLVLLFVGLNSLDDKSAKDSDQNSPESKATDDFLQWLSSPWTSGTKSWALKTGVKFWPVYMIEDPLAYDNLTIAFADVPPVAVNAPDKNSRK